MSDACFVKAIMQTHAGDDTRMQQAPVRYLELVYGVMYMFCAWHFTAVIATIVCPRDPV